MPLPPTIHDLIDSNRRLGEAVLTQSAAVNRAATTLEQLTGVLLRLQGDLSRLLQNRELEEASARLLDQDVSQKLALIDRGVSDVKREVDAVKGGVSEVKGEVSGLHDVPHDRSRTSGVERIIDRLEKTSTGFKVFVVVLVAIIALAGWVHMLWTATAPAGH